MLNEGGLKPDTTDRFTIPTDEQLIKLAILFNKGKIDYPTISNMVSLCRFIIERLNENGDIMVPSSKED